MPKKKITLEEAFAVFEQHGLEVEVKAIAAERKVESLSAFLEHSTELEVPLVEENKKTVRITLFASHSIGIAGEMIVKDGEKMIVGNSIETYGPGVITVPSHLAQHLLHQDLLARRADDRMLENRVRTYVVRPMRTAHGTINVAQHVSNDNGFDLSGFLGKMGSGGIYNLG